jgi:putative peptidoglycan lipid II flippase
VALAESAWMGAAQATEVLEPARLAARRLAAERRLPSLVQLAGLRALLRAGPAALLRRELSISEATVVLMASFLVSALLGAVRQVLFNAQFGAGVEANAYYAAFRLPDTLFSLIAGGALSSAMIPVLLETAHDEGEQAGWRLASLVLTALLGVFALVVLAGEVFAPAFVGGVLAPGFDAETSALTISLTRVMLLQPLILAVGSVATALLNSRSRFIPTALSVASHNVGLILGIVASAARPELGIYGPTLGVLAGALLQVAILLPALTGEFAFRPGLALGDRRLRQVVRLLVPNGLSVGVGYAGFILDTAFASLAPQTAGLAAITNAWLLVGLPIALLGQAVGQSAFPRLAAYATRHDWRALRRTLLLSLGAVLVLALPAVLALLVLGRPTVRILFERGRFDAAAGALTYEVLVRYAAALPFYAATEVITRGLIALSDTRTPLLTNSLQLAGRAAIMAWLVGSSGVLAIPVALAITATIETVVLGIVLLAKLQRRLRHDPGGSDPSSQVPEAAPAAGLAT